MTRRPGMAAAFAVLAAAFATGLAPSPVMTVSAWAEEYRVVPEPSVEAGKWRNATAPYLVEIMDQLSPSNPTKRVTVIKGAQTGVSEALANAAMAYIDLDPCAIMIVHPTIDGVKDWDVEKFTPAVKATKKVADKVREPTSRGRDGSTAKRKVFPGGFMLLAGANSEAALRQHSIRVLFKDDWSGWPLDVEGKGDPDRMAEARQDTYRRRGNYKVGQVSTPGIAGHCRVTKAWLASDQRRWFVPCPHCEHVQYLHFFPDEEGRGGLRYSRELPHQAQYACEDCGALFDQSHLDRINLRGEWRVTNPAGNHPGYSVPKIVSPFEDWNELAGRWISAEGDPSAEKGFYNLDDGTAYEQKGDAPAWKTLKARAEPYPIGRIPPGAWLVTIGCDVQMTSIYYEVVAWGPGKESWSIEAGQIIGNTAEDPATGEIWQAMTTLYERRWQLATGRHIQADMMAIDSRYNTNQVCGWVGRRPFAMAIRGVAGWDRAVFAKAPLRQEKSYAGEARKHGARVWPVNVWGLKGELYANLPKVAGSQGLPPGYCHFPAAHEDRWYQQLTADYLHEEESKGRTVVEWRSRGENHWHDCRIYNMAANHRVAIHFGIAFNDPVAWGALIKARGGGRPLQGELLIDAAGTAGDVVGTPSLVGAAADDAVAPSHQVVASVPHPAPAAAPRMVRPGWITRPRASSWIRR